MKRSLGRGGKRLLTNGVGITDIYGGHGSAEQLDGVPDL